MSDGTFTLRVFSGRGLEVEAEVRSVNVPSEGGELGFLADHRDYVGLLATGFTEYAAVDGDTKRCITSGGVCSFSGNVLTLLADTVDFPELYDASLLNEDLDTLKLELQALSLFDPEWEVVSQRVARIEAVRAFAGR